MQYDVATTIGCAQQVCKLVVHDTTAAAAASGAAGGRVADGVLSLPPGAAASAVLGGVCCSYGWVFQPLLIASVFEAGLLAGGGTSGEACNKRVTSNVLVPRVPRSTLPRPRTVGVTDNGWIQVLNEIALPHEMLYVSLPLQAHSQHTVCHSHSLTHNKENWAQIITNCAPHLAPSS